MQTNYNLGTPFGCRLALQDEIKYATHQQNVIDTIVNTTIPTINAKIDALKATIEWRDSYLKEVNKKMQELAQSLRPTDSRVQYSLNAGSCTVPFDLEVKIAKFEKDLVNADKSLKEAEFKLKFHNKQIKELKEMLGDETEA